MTHHVFEKQHIDCYTQQAGPFRENTFICGVLCKGADGFRFEEEVRNVKPHTRNPKLFDRKYVSLVRRPDGTLKFSFKELGATFDPKVFAAEVYEEISNALKFLQS